MEGGESPTGEPVGRFVGGFGALMVVRYRSSPVGPYDELLFTPGRYAVNVQGRLERHWSVTRIFVSSSESVLGGRRNWGLPKELAELDVRAGRGGSSEAVTCTANGRRVFRAELRALGPRLPAVTWPWRFSLVQERQGFCFVTRVRATGWIRPARIAAIWGDGTRFPDLADLRPVLAVRVARFRMTFPPARTVP